MADGNSPKIGGVLDGVVYRPANPIATYTDAYGDERIIHAPAGARSRALRRFNNSDTPVLRMNRAVAILLGHAVRARRLALGMTAKQLCLRCGFANVNPKAAIYEIETAKRASGVRLGTLYALASALDCEPSDLLPTKAAAMEAAGVEAAAVHSLAAK